MTVTARGVWSAAASTALALLSVVVLSGVVVGCRDDQDPAGARELLTRVRAEEYRTWDRAPGYEARRSSRAPHGNAVDIYINDVVAEALASPDPITEWPIDSIIVKDGFDGSALDLIAIMEKREDGWYWAEFDDKDDSLYSGKPNLCINCHRGSADFVLAFGFPEP